MYGRNITVLRIALMAMTICLLHIELNAQANIKIGYNLGFPSLSINDQILSMYQPPDSEVIQPFGATGYMHGIQLGVRYRWANVSVELGWESIGRDRTSLAYMAATDSFTDREYNYALSGLSFGLDNYFGAFGIGSTLVYQNLGIDRVVGNNDLSIVGQRELGVRIHFIWEIQRSSRVSLVLKPYYQFSLERYDLAPLASDLGVGGLSDTVESPRMFGISLVFYNGRQ